MNIFSAFLFKIIETLILIPIFQISKGESLLRDLAEIEMPDPDKMDEPFD